MLKKNLIAAGTIASIFGLPSVYADTCSGLHITGDVGGKNAKVVIVDNSSINADQRSKIPIGSTQIIQKGKIKKAIVDTATTCAVAVNSAGTVTAVKLAGATLKDVEVDGAEISQGAVTVTVDGVRGILSGVDIDIALVALSPDQKNDPLDIADSTEVVTLTTIKTVDNKTLPAKISLHYADGNSGNYSLYTTGSPSDCWLFCDRRGFSKIDKEFGSKTAVVAADELKNKILVRGWTSGVLVVPYKYVLSSHNFSSSVTVGPYAGYTTDLWGMKLTIPLAAGLTKVTVPTTKNGEASTTEKAAISVATGLMFQPGGKAGAIKTGLLLGVDQLGSNSGYKDNGKVWLGLYVGAGFN